MAYSDRPPVIDLIRTMAQRPLTPKEDKKLDDLLHPPNSRDAFIIKPASDWLTPHHQKNDNERLFGDFWYRDELCILFADTNVGKSILAVQIGDALSRGEAVSPDFDHCREAQQVLYFDFELSARQFEKRYSSHSHGLYQFSNHFYRLVLNPEATGQKRFATYTDYMNNAIENTLISTGARTLIMDNITCLRTGTEASAGAIALMRNLQNIKQKYGLSILVLAHTPKRNPSRPVTRNDLKAAKC